MESISPEQASKIWQRVQRPGEPSQNLELRALELAVLENAGVYCRLQSTLPGSARQLLAALGEDTRRESAMLRGLQLLASQEPPEKKALSPAPASPRELLAGCYHRSIRLLGAYTARTADPLAGCVFQTLAHMSQNHCASIAQLLGSL